MIDLINSGLFSHGDTNLFRPITDNLIHHDPFMVLADFRAYVDCQERASTVWVEKAHWDRMSILNVARMGGFSSDRSIREYAERIWQVVLCMEACPRRSPLAVRAIRTRTVGASAGAVDLGGWCGRGQPQTATTRELNAPALTRPDAESAPACPHAPDRPALAAPRPAARRQDPALLQAMSGFERVLPSISMPPRRSRPGRRGRRAAGGYITA